MKIKSGFLAKWGGGSEEIKIESGAQLSPRGGGGAGKDGWGWAAVSMGLCLLLLWVGSGPGRPTRGAGQSKRPGQGGVRSGQPMRAVQGERGAGA
jgi:hypothetical protein